MDKHTMKLEKCLMINKLRLVTKAKSKGAVNSKMKIKTLNKLWFRWAVTIVGIPASF